MESHRVRLDRGAERIDSALAAVLPLSRTRIRRAIESGGVRVDGRIVRRASAPVAAGSEIELELAAPAAPSILPAAIPLEILWEDEDCLVVDKPAGLVVHPGAGHPDDTLVHALLHHRPEVAGVGDERRAGIVHRLDRDTSGCLIAAKNARAHEALARQFADRTVEKTYWAFAWGHMPATDGVLDAPIGRSPTDRQRMSTRAHRSRSAITRWRVRERFAVADWLELGLETGRTHQIRVHLAAAGHPVLGDARYGGGPARARGFHGPQQEWAREAAALAPRQALHACALAFDRPSSRERIRVASPLPADLEALRAALRRHPA